MSKARLLTTTADAGQQQQQGAVAFVNPYAGRFIPLPKNGERCPITNLCRASLYNYAARGHLRLVKIGSRVLLDGEHAFAWLASQPSLEVKRILPETAARTHGDRPQSATRAA